MSRDKAQQRGASETLSIAYVFFALTWLYSQVRDAIKSKRQTSPSSPMRHCLQLVCMYG